MTKIVRSDVCWLEVYENGAVGPDFGWPGEADKFAYLGPSPRPDRSWPQVLADWLDTAGCAGEAVLGGSDGPAEKASNAADDPLDGPSGEWTRAYLEADDVCLLLADVFGEDDPGARALQTRLDPRHRYIAFALCRTWVDDTGDDNGDPGEPVDPPPDLPRAHVPVAER